MAAAKSRRGARPRRPRRTTLAVLAAGALVLGCSEAGDGGPSLLLVTLDTTDPSALGCYGGPDGLTPALDALAAEGLVFDNARTVAPLTLPAHASMLTGLVPLRHGVRRNGGGVLADEVVTLAERATGAGIQTAAFVSAVVLDREFGLDQGFAVYADPPTPAAAQEQLDASLTGEAVVERALAWLAERDRSRPFFLWVHLFDPHYPYEPAERFLERAGGDAYLGEVAAADDALGRLVDALRNEGALERTTVIAVGDHGEARGRRGEQTHGTFVYDTTLRVPLIVRPADALERAPARVDAVASVVDVFPTALGALGLGAHGDVDGVDLVAPLPPDRGAYFECYLGFVSFHWSHLAGWVTSEGKLIHSSAPELYDIAADPEERVQRIDAEPELAERARRGLAELAARPRFRAASLDDAYRGVLGQIERLGYAGTGELTEALPEPLAPSDRPSPHQRIAAYADYKEAQKRLVAGDAEGAVELLRGVVEGNPGNHKAQFSLGLALQRLNRFEEAAAAFRAALRSSGGERITAELNLAVCYHNLGQTDLAIEHAERALADTIGPPGALPLLIDLLEAGGRHEDAERQRRRLRAAEAP